MTDFKLKVFNQAITANYKSQSDTKYQKHLVTIKKKLQAYPMLTIKPLHLITLKYLIFHFGKYL